MQWAATQAAGAGHVYRYTPRSRHFLLRWLPGYALGISWGLGSQYVFHPHHANLALFAAIQASYALAGIVICAVLIRRLATLTISPDGLLYESGARRLWVLWRDIAAVGPWHGGRSGRIGGMGLVVRPGALRPHDAGWRGTRALLYPAGMVRPALADGGHRRRHPPLCAMAARPSAGRMRRSRQ